MLGACVGSREMMLEPLRREITGIERIDRDRGENGVCREFTSKETLDIDW